MMTLIKVKMNKKKEMSLLEEKIKKKSIKWMNTRK